MTDLDTIKNTLDTNTYLSQEMKDNIFELVVLFNKNFNQIALNNLNERLKTLKIEKISSFLSKRVSRYDIHKNTIYFNDKELKKDYDVRHILMLELINIISSNNEFSGFNYEDKFEEYGNKSNYIKYILRKQMLSESNQFTQKVK